MKIKILLKKYILLVAGLSMLAGVCVRTVFIWRFNADSIAEGKYIERDYGENNQNAKYNPYKMRVPMEEMDIATALSYTRRSNIIAGGGPEYYLMTLPIGIRYYLSTKFGARPEFVIPKGTKVFVYPISYGHFKIYGLDTIPTYEHGWRYATPLIEAEEDVWYKWNDWSAWHYGFSAPVEYYYIRTADVIKLEHYFLNNTIPEFYDYIHENWNVSKQEVTTYTWEEATERTLSVDLALYREGAYLSPDLYRPYFDTWNIALLASGGAFVVIWAICVMRAGHAGHKGR